MKKKTVWIIGIGGFVLVGGLVALSCLLPSSPRNLMTKTTKATTIPVHSLPTKTTKTTNTKTIHNLLGLNYVVLRDQLVKSNTSHSSALYFDISVKTPLSDSQVIELGKAVYQFETKKNPVDSMYFHIFNNQTAFEKFKSQGSGSDVYVSGLLQSYTLTHTGTNQVDFKSYQTFAPETNPENLLSSLAYNVVGTSQDHHSVLADVVMTTSDPNVSELMAQSIASAIESSNSGITQVSLQFYPSQTDYSKQQVTGSYSTTNPNIFISESHSTF